MSGYPGKPLIEKLGYEPSQTIVCINAPEWFIEQLEENGNTVTQSQSSDWLHGFFANLSQFNDFLESTDLDKISKGLWVSWPKKSSGMQTDLNEQMFRDYILPLGWVDTKVAAIDETWSGLKFVRRKL